MTLATKITITRIALIPVLIICFLIDFPYHYLTAALFFIFMAATDFIDGAVARKTNTVSDLGKILDPIADKALSITAMILCVCDAQFFFNVAFIFMITIMITRELLISILRMLVLRKGKALAADVWGKIKTIFINVSIPFVIVAKQFEQYVTFNNVVKGIGSALFAIGFVFTVISAINYCVKNKDVFMEMYHDSKKDNDADKEQSNDN